MRAYLIAAWSPPQRLVDGDFVIEHRPKPGARGIRYHLGEIRYGLGMLASAIAFRADYFVIQSGMTHFFILPLFSLFSIKVIPVLHNTLWPAGYPPRSLVQRFILRADAIFFRLFADAILCVSSECYRQIVEVTGGRSNRVFTMLPQFDRELFGLTPAPPHSLPLRLLYAGRVVRSKGVFDLLEIVAAIERTRPSAVMLRICGDGPDLPELRQMCEDLQLSNLVEIEGRIEPVALRKLLIESHAAIIPTRSDFAEGLAMSAIEPILLGRPIITNPVVPALESLREAAIVAKTNDVASYVDGILALVESPAMYERLVSATATIREQFFDPERSFRTILKRAISD
ncbi:glycosyltransferase family 4 protein [Bradyrhizobium symbiodeficiens]|uniref:glycosyltransferase family 4 protein n=1 Tax=Bradyrhizobium symbiodeficiens TaxID=1404367 RepID=UPI0030D3DD22